MIYFTNLILQISVEISINLRTLNCDLSHWENKRLLNSTEI